MQLDDFKKLIKLLQLKREFSGFYKESNEREWLAELKKEILELEKEIDAENKEKIKDELGDVMIDFVCVVDKIKSKYELEISEIINKVEEKLRRRAPHFFEGRFLPKDKEIEQWIKGKRLEANV